MISFTKVHDFAVARLTAVYIDNFFAGSRLLLISIWLKNNREIHPFYFEHMLLTIPTRRLNCGNSPVTKRVQEWVLNAPMQQSQSKLGSFGWTKNNDGGWDKRLSKWPFCPAKQYVHGLRSNFRHRPPLVLFPANSIEKKLIRKLVFLVQLAVVFNCFS